MANPTDTGGLSPETMAAVQAAQSQIKPPGFAGSGGLQDPNYLPPAPQPSATLPGMDPNAAQWNAQNQYINAQQQYLNAKQGTLGPQQAVIGAKGSVYDAQAAALPAKQAQIGANSAYLAEQTRANEASRSEYEAIKAAKQNTGDIIGVTRAQRDRNNQAYRYQLAGIDVPIEIDLPEGYTGPVPAGMIGRLQTLSEKLTNVAKDNEKMRSFSLEAARIRYNEAGIEVDKKQLDVEAAQIQAGRVGLTLDQAELAAQRAGLDVDQAGIRKALAAQPPAPGYEFDEETQQWMPKSDLESLQAYRKTQAGGKYGYFSVDALASEAVRGTLTETELRNVLTSPPPEGKGLLPSTADVILESVRLRKLEKEDSAGGLDPETLKLLKEIENGNKTVTNAPQRGPDIRNNTSGTQYWNSP